MYQSNLSRLVRTAFLPVFVGCLTAASIGACKPRGGADAATTSASGHPSAAAAASSSPTGGGACSTYANQLCDKAGTDTPTCQSIRAVTDVLPPSACSAGLKDIDYSAKKLAAARHSCEDLEKKLCEAVGPDTPTCQLVKSRTKQFGVEQCTAMLEHVSEIVTELQGMEQANKPLSKEQQAALVANPSAAFGPANSRVQIVEFSDFQCPFCSRAADVVHQIKEKYGDRVRFVFRQYPLPMHPEARGAAEAALAANSQGKFWEFHDRLFKNQQQLSRAALEEHAKQSGLNVAAFKKSLDDHKFGTVVDADLELGQKTHVDGTPTMFINGARVADPTSFQAVSAQIESALKSPTPG